MTQQPQEKAVKVAWASPKLIVFGDVDVLTLGRNKNYGIGDAFTFQNETTRLSS